MNDETVECPISDLIDYVWSVAWHQGNKDEALVGSEHEEYIRNVEALVQAIK